MDNDFFCPLAAVVPYKCTAPALQLSKHARPEPPTYFLKRATISIVNFEPFLSRASNCSFCQRRALSPQHHSVLGSRQEHHLKVHQTHMLMNRGPRKVVSRVPTALSNITLLSVSHKKYRAISLHPLLISSPALPTFP